MFKTYPKSSRCPPPLHNQPYLDWVLTRITAYGCLCTWLSPLCPCRWLLGKNNLIWIYTRSHCCSSQNPSWLPIPLWFKATVLTTGSRSASWRGGWSPSLIHPSCSVLLIAWPLYYPSHLTASALAILLPGTFFLQIFTRCLSLGFFLSLLKSHLISEVFPDPVNQDPTSYSLDQCFSPGPYIDLQGYLAMSDVATTGVCECARVYLCVCAIYT